MQFIQKHNIKMHKVYGNINTLKYAIYGEIYKIVRYKNIQNIEKVIIAQEYKEMQKTQKCIRKKQKSKLKKQY